MKKEHKKLGKNLITADEARKLVKSEQLPDDWLEVSLEKISERIRFQAESMSNHEAMWECQIQIMTDNGVWKFIPIKDEKKIEVVMEILESREYSVEMANGMENRVISIKW